MENYRRTFFVKELYPRTAGFSATGLQIAETFQHSDQFLPSEVPGQGEKAAQPAPGKILQKDALDRILGAEGQNLTRRRRTQLRHPPILPLSLRAR